MPLLFFLLVFGVLSLAQSFALSRWGGRCLHNSRRASLLSMSLLDEPLELCEVWYTCIHIHTHTYSYIYIHSSKHHSRVPQSL